MIATPTTALLDKYMVHRLHERQFMRIDPYTEKPGAICTCGHPARSHAPSCLLIDSCGCAKVSKALEVNDVRPFYQVTHGPMESHALGRGIALAKRLGVEIQSFLECKNFCSQYRSLGACRHPRSSLGILTKNTFSERHLIYCDRCLEDLCIKLYD